MSASHAPTKKAYLVKKVGGALEATPLRESRPEFLERTFRLQQQLFNVALRRAKDIQQEEAVIALCEKHLAAFLRDFLSRQPNVAVVPAIRFVYKNK